MVTNVKTEWVDGNLVFYDKSKNIIFTVDGTNRKLTFPSGAEFELQSGATADIADILLQAADLALAEGSVLVGNSAGAAAALNAKADGRIIVGNATTATSVAVSGDITLSNAGVVAIATGVIVDADVNASAAIARSKLAEDALVAAVPINVLSNAGAALLAAETAGTFNIAVGTNTLLIQGETCDNETEASIGYALVTLPENYVAAGDITVRLPAALIKVAAAVNDGSTLDVEAFKQASGAVGADICATAAATFAADDTWYNKDFTVTATGLAAGDKLLLKITATVIDSEAGGGTLRLNMEAPQLLLDVRG